MVDGIREMVNKKKFKVGDKVMFNPDETYSNILSQGVVIDVTYSWLIFASYSVFYLKGGTERVTFRRGNFLYDLKLKHLLNSD